MITTNNPLASLRKLVRYLEWLVLLTSLLAGLLSTYFRDHPQLLPLFYIYMGAFFGLSHCFPIDRPLWQRRLYVTVELLLILSALSMRLWFDLLMYFLLAKSCFFLRWREVVVAAIALGIGNIMLSAWILPQRVAEVVERIQAGIPVYHVPTILWVNAINYLGTSLMAICFGLLLVAERNSRQRAESLAQQVELQAAMLERTRIAREMHDLLGHSLTALDVQLELTDRLYESDRKQAYHALMIARQIARQCFQDVRRSVQMMRRSQFDLNQALIALADQIHQRNSLQVQLDIKLPNLPVHTSHQLYCIIQEGLTNVQKHANATVVHLCAYTKNTEIWLELDDDGIGFNPNETTAGFGLQGMQERIQLLNGQLSIHSVEGRGTQLLVRVPQ
jgi:signal transduction histidine kinase